MDGINSECLLYLTIVICNIKLFLAANGSGFKKYSEHLSFLLLVFR